MNTSCHRGNQGLFIFISFSPLVLPALYHETIEHPFNQCLQHEDYRFFTTKLTDASSQNNDGISERKQQLQSSHERTLSRSQELVVAKGILNFGIPLLPYIPVGVGLVISHFSTFTPSHLYSAPLFDVYTLTTAGKQAHCSFVIVVLGYGLCIRTLLYNGWLGQRGETTAP